MKPLFISFCLFLSFVSNALASEAQDTPSDTQEKAKTEQSQQKEDLGYILGAGDTIQISVFKEPEMTTRLKIHRGGYVNFPYLGEIKLSGRTPTQIEEDIEARLADGYILQPMVTVSIEAFRKFFISGEVANPNGYEFQPGLTVEQAIAMAGGFTDRSDRDSINVRSAATNELIEDVAPTYPVGPGDVVIIEQSFF
ncbi:polysaccharide biosynthesis/export family protein [Aliivibrio fischeri]|uniref:Polysaccharide export protein n=1 Tax=Aliivibrio fischeri TaxID=668 RepID=A0A6N3Z3M3_ALIFS|nr:polysaccharide biosynthesis/export family protein [Aliivibrio fischeri]MBP3140899.1 polysaccharide export protein [Aliivibrio fischeri]MBP3155793.1 polysaccharide export protein [Aliivibrio fischeri]MCE7567728.1 polysaccharide export protein [Aliivibrio fischeri]MCE7575162.1 polysaccharide export protein [Aliivibrio fischeri]MCE7579090.1 polysaccharide export protein [Aliivibrio fischeri]